MYLRKIDGSIKLLFEDDGYGFDLKKGPGRKAQNRDLDKRAGGSGTELSRSSFDIESGREEEQSSGLSGPFD